MYNQLEQLVSEAVDRVVDSIDAKRYPDVCGCSQCRLDVVCFVLNRMLPKYVVSERGFTHTESSHTLQESADLIAQVKEGIERVSATKRPGHGSLESQRVTSGPCFVFPVITGRILDGTRFEPVATAKVELRIDGAISEMQRPGWTNPLSLPPQAEGRYSFWPAPIVDPGRGNRTIFDLDLCARSDEFEQVHHLFQLELAVSVTGDEEPNATYAVPNFYLFSQA